MDQIIPGLWLGPRPDASRISKLNFNGVKAILTVDIQPLRDSAFLNFKRMHISADDTPHVNLLKSFEKAIDFIEENIGDGILVHCLAGSSRSATIVIAYMMWKFKIPFDVAFGRVRRVRRINPNEGFIRQLKCFERMNFMFDPSSEAYGELLAETALLSPPNQFLSSSRPAFYVCRLCRTPVFRFDDLISHNRPSQQETSAEVPCEEGELFTEHLDWMNGVTCEIQGKLYCTRCMAKLGSFNWCGEPCVCGKWVTPAFHFCRKHLDEVRTPTTSEVSRTSTTTPRTTFLPVNKTPTTG